MSRSGGLNSVLIANRGEIAIRIARAAAELGLHSVAIYSQDDGARIDTSDPLAVLNHGKRALGLHASVDHSKAPPFAGAMVLPAPLQGTIVAIDVCHGDLVRKGQQVLVMESMKMEHVISASDGGYVRSIEVVIGDAVIEGAALLTIEPVEMEPDDATVVHSADLDHVRDDLKEVNARRQRTLDAARPAAGVADEVEAVRVAKKYLSYTSRAPSRNTTRPISAACGRSFPRTACACTTCAQSSTRSFKRSMGTVAWPTGEFGGMGLEGAAKLAYRNELAQIADPAERRRKYEEMVAQMYERGKALSIATIFGVDDAIDPADTRLWLANLLRSLRPSPRPAGKKRFAIDPW